MGLRERLHVDPYGNLTGYRTAERIRKAFSPRYVLGKLLLTYHEIRHPDEPWITQDAVLMFDAMLRPHHKGLEWGSGNGSVWIAKRCASLVSVEHYAPWYRKVCEKIREAGVTNIDYRMVEEGRYVATIDEFPDEHFSFVVVDGLFRDEAFLRSIPKVEPGGFILFDNVNWYLPSESKTVHSRSLADGPLNEIFARGAELVKSWKTLWTSNGVNDTAFFIKPIRAERAPRPQSPQPMSG